MLKIWQVLVWVDQLDTLRTELHEIHLNALKQTRAAFLEEIQTESSNSQPAKSGPDAQRTPLEMLQ